MTKNINSSILKNNKFIKTSTGVWSIDTEGSFLYTDGAESEDALINILQKANDKSSTSNELENASYDWISEYHLSSERANIYRFLNLENINSGLELGSGCGAITRYLGECDIHLDAIEGSLKRAQICRLRCEDLKNVEVYHSNFNSLELPSQNYDAVFLNGVLEYAKRFLDSSHSDQQALLDILNRSISALSPDGIICIAIENRMGLKYWLGAKEDHFATPYIGLYGYPNNQGIRTYDKNEWQLLLSQLGEEFNHRFIYPFPDYKMARAILTDSFLKDNPNAHSHLYRLFSTDNGNSIESPQNEFLTWEALHSSNALGDYANSFFLVLSRNRDILNDICPFDFMHFFRAWQETTI